MLLTFTTCSKIQKGLMRFRGGLEVIGEVLEEVERGLILICQVQNSLTRFCLVWK